MPPTTPRRRVLLAAAGVVVAAALGVAVGFAHADGSPSDGPGPLVVVTTVIGAIGVVLIVVTGLWAWRTGAFARSRGNPALGSDQAARRRLRREIRGREPVDPARLEAVVAAARAVVDRQWLVVLYLGMALTFTGQFGRTRPFVQGALAVLAAVLVVAAITQMVVDTRRARRFLAEHDRSHRPRVW